MIVIYGMMGGHAVLCFVLALVKCTKIFFSQADDALCLFDHPKQCSWRYYSVPHQSSAVLPKAKVFIYSLKPISEACRVGGLQASTRLVL
jgi:hypothetical protein